MPSAAKLIGGLLLALLSIYTTRLFLETSNSVYAIDRFYFVNAIIGFLVGWRSIGFDPGFGGMGSIVSGLRGSFLMMVVCAVVFGLWVVIAGLLRFYIKEFESVVDSWYYGALNYASSLTDVRFLVALVIGGCIAGIASGLANRYWT